MGVGEKLGTVRWKTKPRGRTFFLSDKKKDFIRVGRLTSLYFFSAAQVTVHQSARVSGKAINAVQKY